MFELRQARLSISFFLGLAKRLERSVLAMFEISQPKRRKKIVKLFFLWYGAFRSTKYFHRVVQTLANSGIANP
jgi:hypothetical protein